MFTAWLKFNDKTLLGGGGGANLNQCTRQRLGAGLWQGALGGGGGGDIGWTRLGSVNCEGPRMGPNSAFPCLKPYRIATQMPA